MLLTVAGVKVRTWLGTMHEAEARALADSLNAALRPTAPALTAEVRALLEQVADGELAVERDAARAALAVTQRRLEKAHAKIKQLRAEHAAAWEKANATLRSMLLPCQKCGEGVREGTLCEEVDGKLAHLVCPQEVASEVTREYTKMIGRLANYLETAVGIIMDYGSCDVDGDGDISGARALIEEAREYLV